MFFGRRSHINEFEAEALPHWNDLYRTALSQLKDEAVAEDVLQEAYLKAWKSFHQFRKGTDCRAWLFRIMFNCIHDHHRQWFNTKTVGEPEDAIEGHFPYAPPIPDGLTDEDIVNAVQGLAVNYRAVVLLADVEEFSYKEIAEVLNLPMGTARNVGPEDAVLDRKIAKVERFKQDVFRHFATSCAARSSSSTCTNATVFLLSDLRGCSGTPPRFVPTSRSA